MSSGGSIVANIELKIVHTDPNNTSQKETAAGGDGSLFGTLMTSYLAVFQIMLHEKQIWTQVFSCDQPLCCFFNLNRQRG